MTKLSEKQRRFVEAYMGVANGNATEAARIAGYAGDDNTLSVVASENLRKPNILTAIRDRQENDPLVLSRQERQEFLSMVVRGEIKEAEGKETQLINRLRASEQLNKMGGDYVEKREHRVTGIDVGFESA